MENEAQDQPVPCVNLVLVNMIAITNDLLCSAFRQEQSIQVIGSASTTKQLDTILSQGHPDVALIGTQGWGRESMALPFLEQITLTAPSVRQIVMAAEMGREDLISFFRGGARGLLCGSQTNLPQLFKCIRCVAMGQIWADSAQLDVLVRSLSLPRSLKVTNVVGDSLLSHREEQVLHLLADGMSNRELATELKISEHTVKNHLFRIFDKLGVSNRMEAVLYAISQREQRGSSLLDNLNTSTTHRKGKSAFSKSSTRLN